MTYREYVQKNYPQNVREIWFGGVLGCPSSYVKNAPDVVSVECKNVVSSALDALTTCTNCYNAEIPHDAVDANTGKRVYPYKVKIKRKKGCK